MIKEHIPTVNLYMIMLMIDNLLDISKIQGKKILKEEETEEGKKK